MKNRVFSFLLVLALVMLLFIACFSNELGLWMQEGVNGLGESSSAPNKILSMEDSQKIVGYRLVDSERDARKVEVRYFSANMENAYKVDINFTLVNNGVMHFPKIRVLMKDANSKVLRTINVAPSQYGAKGKFSKQLVTLHIPLERGEVRVSVTPYYEAEGEK